MILVTELIRMPIDTTDVNGGTSFSMLISRPSSANKFLETQTD